MEKVDIKTRRIKAGKYAYDGEYTDDAYTIRKHRYGWSVLTGYGNQKEYLNRFSSYDTKKEAVEAISERETKYKGAQEAREMGLDIEKKVKLRKGSVRMGGFIGGRRWTMLSRLRLDGEPITEWLDGMKHDSSKEKESDALARMAREEGHENINRWHIEGLTKVNSDAYSEGRDRLSIPNWASSGGAGLSKGEKRHWILK